MTTEETHRVEIDPMDSEYMEFMRMCFDHLSDNTKSFEQGLIWLTLVTGMAVIAANEQQSEENRLSNEELTHMYNEYTSGVWKGLLDNVTTLDDDDEVGTPVNQRAI